MYLPAADDQSPVQKNPRCDRRAREPAFSRNPGWHRLNLRGHDHASGRYAEALAELGLKPGDRVAAQVENRSSRSCFIAVRSAPGDFYAPRHGNKPSSPALRTGRGIFLLLLSTISVILLALEKDDGFDIR